MTESKRISWTLCNSIIPRHAMKWKMHTFPSAKKKVAFKKTPQCSRDNIYSRRYNQCVTSALRNSHLSCSISASAGLHYSVRSAGSRGAFEKARVWKKMHIGPVAIATGDLVQAEYFRSAALWGVACVLLIAKDHVPREMTRFRAF